MSTISSKWKTINTTPSITILAVQEMIRIIVFSFLAGQALTASLTNGLLPMPDGRIVGGQAANIEEYPYQILMKYGGGYRCGGSILKPNVIISAAHCVIGLLPDILSIVAGTAERDSNKGVEIKVLKYIIHDNYDHKTIDFDLSLSVLKASLSYSDRIQPIALPEQDALIKAGTPSYVSGWGDIREGSSGPSTLHVVQVEIIEQEKCDTAYERFGGVTDRMLCAGVPEGGKDACSGDSGGPLVADNRLIGIVSFGYGCARPDYPGVYSRVSAMRDWIDSQIPDN